MSAAAPLIGDDFRASPFSPQAIRRAVLAMVVWGVALRLVRYGMHFPLWADEAMLAANFRSGSYSALLEPLAYQQVAPIFYLWLVRAVVDVLGFHEYALRLISCVASVASVPLFYRVASRWLTGAPLLIAVALFAVSYYPVRYAGEVKPYALDLLVSLTLTGLGLAWLRRPGRSRELWVLACAAPVAVGLSFPAVFIAGGIGIGLATVLVTKRRPWGLKAPVLVAYAGFALLTIGAFIANYFFVIRAQYDSATGATLGFWSHAFPPLTDPPGLVRWFFAAHTGRMFGYPVGGSDGGSTLTFVLFVIGVYVWWRAGRRHALAVLLGPLVLMFVAAAMQRYPYGGSGRIFQHMAPAICLLAGTGGGALITLGRHVKARRQALAATTAVLILFGAGLAVHSIGWPRRYAHDQEDRVFARWLWNQYPKDGTVVCAVTDLDLSWAAKTRHLYDGAKYLCNQRIYSPRHRQAAAPDWSAVADGDLLHVVAPHWERPDSEEETAASGIRALEARHTRWLDRMSEHYRYLGYQDFLRELADAPGHRNGGWIRVYEFEKRGDTELVGDF